VQYRANAPTCALSGSSSILPGHVTTHSLFPTLVYSTRLPRARAAALNARLLRECRQLRVDDAAGRRWSKQSYPGGYTSYGSASRMHQVSPSFRMLQRLIDEHVRTFARQLRFDLMDRRLEMTDCWVNIMPRQTAHGLHLHPLSALSGVYYVKTPKGCPGLKFEDPRLERFMAAPPRLAGSRPWVVIPARSGGLLLFESWLRHEVAANAATGERVSVSFNYGWF
jgi:uncharacterized protein (TIGR02466 family)